MCVCVCVCEIGSGVSVTELGKNLITSCLEI